MQWQSSSSGILNTHNEIFSDVKTHLTTGFEAMYKALKELETEILGKVDQIQERQVDLLTNAEPCSTSSLIEVQRNRGVIRKSLEAFSSHAENLSHIRLTLSRAAALVNVEGNLYNLIVVKEEPPVEIQRQLAVERSLEFGYQRAIPLQGEYSDLESMYRNLHLEDQSSLVSTYREPTDRLASVQSRDRLVFSQPRYRPPPPFEPQYPSAFETRYPVRPERFPRSTCFVFYLPPSVTNESLRELFSRYGTVLNAYVAMDRVTNRMRGFGFIDYSSPQEAEAAVAGLDKMPLEGKFLSVSIKV